MPLPDPEAPEVTVIQAALLVAAQLHPAGAVTVVLPVVAPAARVWLVGDTVNVHGTGADCVIVTV